MARVRMRAAHSNKARGPALGKDSNRVGRLLRITGRRSWKVSACTCVCVVLVVKDDMSWCSAKGL